MATSWLQLLQVIPGILAFIKALLQSLLLAVLQAISIASLQNISQPCGILYYQKVHLWTIKQSERLQRINLQIVSRPILTIDTLSRLQVGHQAVQDLGLTL